MNKPTKDLVVHPRHTVSPIIPQGLNEVSQLATVVARANLAPLSYNNDPQKIAVGVMHGMEIGFTPMAALQSIAVINGQPSIWGDAALALVRSSDLLDSIEEKLEQDPKQGLTAVCIVKRKGQKNARVEKFSQEDAKRANLWGKKGPWTQYPKRMLQLRARGFALRDEFGDVLRGLRFTEEMRDVTPDMELGQEASGSAYVPTENEPLEADFVEDAQFEDVETESAEAADTPAEDNPGPDSPASAGDDLDDLEGLDEFEDLDSADFTTMLKEKIDACADSVAVKDLWIEYKEQLGNIPADEKAKLLQYAKAHQARLKGE